MTHPTPDDAHLRAEGGPPSGGFQDGDNPPPQDRVKNEPLDDEDGETPDREDELLDEGLEETFPASDPVSSKHIT